MPVPENQVPPQIDMQKWGDRMVSPAEAADVCIDPRAAKPIAVKVTADEIGALYAAQKGACNPNLFTQFLLERFKFFGAPVEGAVVFKLAHGRIARVKTNPMQEQEYFQYIWLPDEYVAAIANAGGVH